MEQQWVHRDDVKWVAREQEPENTLQMFITNRCNNSRCRGCFYRSRLGEGDMSLDFYKEKIEELLGEESFQHGYHGGIRTDGPFTKVTLLGGEPTLHPELREMVRFNYQNGLKTTIYTNGENQDPISDLFCHGSIPPWFIKIRVGILGLKESEKPLLPIGSSLARFPYEVVYMLRRDNVSELLKTAQLCNDWGCKSFMISSIRDIAATGSYWKDTDETLPLDEYLKVVNQFLKDFEGTRMPIEVSRRAVVPSKVDIPHCRFLNVFPNGDMILCPFDICKNITEETFDGFGSRPCNKREQGCILQKICLTRT